METIFDQQNDGYAEVDAHRGGVLLDVGEVGTYQRFAPQAARALAAALLRAADEADGQTPPIGWFSDLANEDGRDEDYPWQPFVQIASCCLPLPIWFASEAECDSFVRELVGRGFLPGEGE